MSSSAWRRAPRSCRSTRRTACIVRPATSRTRRRTSTGSRRKAAGAPAIRAGCRPTRPSPPVHYRRSWPPVLAARPGGCPGRVSWQGVAVFVQRSRPCRAHAPRSNTEAERGPLRATEKAGMALRAKRLRTGCFGKARCNEQALLLGPQWPSFCLRVKCFLFGRSPGPDRFAEPPASASGRPPGFVRFAAPPLDSGSQIRPIAVPGA